MFDVFDDIIDRQASPADVSRIAAIVASDFRFAYFGTARRSRCGLLRLDQKLMDGIPMNPRRRSNTHRNYESALFADGRAVEIPVV